MNIEIRNDAVEISGYVNAVGRESRVLRDASGYFTEVCAPGVFARALQRGKRQMLLNHDEARVLGNEGENLELHEDAVGLFARATVTDPDVIGKARKGELRGWSFGFVPIAATREEREGVALRTLQDIDLREVSIIDNRKMPAYVATSVFTRAMEDGEPLEYRMMEAQDWATIDKTESRAEEPPQVDYQPYFDRINALRKG